MISFEIPIPEELRDKVLDTVVDALDKKLKGLPFGDKVTFWLNQLHSDANFKGRFSKALKEATARFTSEYKDQDVEIVRYIATNHQTIFENKEVREAIVNVLKKPDRYLDDDDLIIKEHFISLSLQDISSDRIDKAISYFLKCLAQSVWLMPEFKDIYSLLFQKMTAEGVKKQVQLAEMQLKLTSDVRDSLSIISENIQRQFQLSPSSNPSPPSSQINQQLIPNSINPGKYLGEIPEINVFWGREDELSRIYDWLLVDNCRIISILGIGGMGKTTLAAKIAQESSSDFDFIIWKSLRNAPQLDEVLQEFILTLSNQQDISVDKNMDKLINRLIEYTKNNRCLIVLDNFEALLDSEKQAGQYRNGYESFSKLIERFSVSSQKSCILLTSREKPQEVGFLEGDMEFVRSFYLNGIKSSDGHQLLKGKGLIGSEEAWGKLVSHYSGNPLALKMVAEMINEVYSGNIKSFLDDGAPVFSLIRDVIGGQFSRLSLQEQSILYWLAIERESVKLDDLRENIITSTSKKDLMLALQSLRRRSLIEQSQNGFTLQNVVMEYLSDQLIEIWCDEIVSQKNIPIQLPKYNYETDVFVSYAWGGESERVVDKLEQAFTERGIRIVRDKKDLDYKGSIETFEKRIGMGQCVILIISDKYLRSEHCMYELTEVEKNKNLRDRIFPVVLADAQIYNPIDRLSYIKYWNEKIELLDQAIKQVDLLTHLDGFTSDLNKYAHIRTSFDHLTNLLGDMNALTPEIHSNNGFSTLISAVENTLNLSSKHNNDTILKSPHKNEANRLPNLNLFHKYPVVMAQGKDYIRQSQIRMLLNPLLQKLDSVFISKNELINTMQNILSVLRQDLLLKDGYAAGNIFNILTQSEIDLKGFDFSNLTIRQADFRKMNLQGIDFRNAIFSKNAFFDTFGEITSLAFSPSSETLAIGSADGSIRLWDLITKTPLWTINPFGEWVLSVDFSVTGELLSCCGGNQNIILIDVKTGKVRSVLQGHTNVVRTVSFDKQGTSLASGGNDHSVRLWEFNTGKQVGLFEGHSGTVRSVGFNPQGSILASGSEDCTIRLWNLSTGQCLKILKGHTDLIRAVAFTPNGKMVVSSGDDQTIRLWDVDTGEDIRIFEGHKGRVRSIDVSSDGRLLVSGSDDQTIRIWDINTGDCEQVLQGHSNSIWSVKFSKLQPSLVVSGGSDQCVKSWDLLTGKAIDYLKGYTNQTGCVSYHPILTHQLVSGNEDGKLRFWDTESGNCIKTLPGHRNRILRVVFSPDGKTLATSSADQTIILWDSETKKQKISLHGHENWIWSISFSNNGKVLASGCEDRTVKFWNCESGENIHTIKLDSPIWTIGFSPSGNLLAIGRDDGVVQIWNTNNYSLVMNLPGHSGRVWSLLWVSENVLASGSYDHTINLWSIESNKCIKTLTGYEGLILSLAKSIDSSTIIGSGSDNKICLWNITTGDITDILNTEFGWIWSIDFNSTGLNFVCSGNQQIIIWDFNKKEISKTLRIERPYEKMNISGARGLSDDQKNILITLGTIS